MKNLIVAVFLIVPFIGISQCKGDCENGNGTYKWESGDKYVGEWVDSKFEGQGTMYYNDGTILNGIWKNGLFQKVIEKEIPTRSLGYKFIDKPTYGKVWVLLIGVSDYINLPDLK